MKRIASNRNYKVVTAGLPHKFTNIIRNLPESKDLAGYIETLLHIIKCGDKDCEDSVVQIMDPSKWHLTYDPKEEGGSMISLIKAGDKARIESALFEAYSKELGLGEANDKADNIVARIMVAHSVITE